MKIPGHLENFQEYRKWSGRSGVIAVISRVKSGARRAAVELAVGVSPRWQPPKNPEPAAAGGTRERDEHYGTNLRAVMQ
jgi:hypothetical protein